MVQTVGGCGCGDGGSPVPFVVSEWDMTGSLSTAIPLTTQGGTLGGSSPNFTLAPSGPLPGSGPGTYISMAVSGSGILVSDTGQKFAKMTLPAFDGGDNIFALGFFICNSGASDTDIVTVLNGGSPVNPVWGVNTIIMQPVLGGTSSSTPYVNSVAGSSTSGPSGWASSDVAYFGMDYDTGNAVIQRNAGAITQLSALDLTGLPGGQTLKVVMLMGFASATPTLLNSPLVFNPGTTDGGKTAFSSIGEATLPVGAADGKVYKVSVAGTFGGITTEVGSFVQLYDTTTKIIPTPNPATIPSLTAGAVASDVRLDALELVRTTDTSVVATVTPGCHAFGAVPAGNIKQLVQTANNQTFTLSAASGKVAKFLCEVVFSGYSPNTNDIVTLNGVKFNAASTPGAMWEVYHNPVESILNLRVDRYRDPQQYANIALADAVTTDDIPHCSSTHIVLGNGVLTGDLASFTLAGTQYDHLIDLYGQITVEVGTGSAFGIVNFQGTSFGLAAGEKAIRYPGGIWIKL